jgi:hypothetical protein
MLAALGGNLRQSRRSKSKAFAGVNVRAWTIGSRQKTPSPVERFGIEVIVGVLGTTSFGSLC